MNYYLAIDLGASSGRHIVGYFQNGKIQLEEIHRFKTGMDESEYGLIWNIPRLWNEILRGIRKAFEKYGSIVSLSIDTWGVDYVLMNGDEEIPPYYAYRNARCQKASEALHQKIPLAELYSRTGIQFASFNTLYQLYDDLKQGRLEQATDYLMLPSYFTYKLTGIKTHEYTNESTGALLDASSGTYAFDILDRAGLPRKLFGPIQQPGSSVGELLPEIQKEVGGNCKVLLCASHDTGSAFESVDVPRYGVILSSGTWSLLGIKSPKPIINEESAKANYTNEGGVGYIRFLKNIMGMWVPNRAREELGLSQIDINKRVVRAKIPGTFDVNDPSLVAPKSMKQATLALLKDNPPKDDMELFASIYASLALSYKNAIEELENITGKKFRSIYVLGGGAKNRYLNKLIEKATSKKVVALPIEATALGNIKIQMKGNHEL